MAFRHLLTANSSSQDHERHPGHQGDVLRPHLVAHRADTPWVSELMTWPEEKVREVTNGAVTAVNEGSLSVPDAASAGRGALSPLPGFDTGYAFTSALFWQRRQGAWAVYDRRAQAGLEALGRTLSRRAAGTDATWHW
jgi:hypothetical protein